MLLARCSHVALSEWPLLRLEHATPDLPAAVTNSLDARTARKYVQTELVRKPIDVFKGQVAKLEKSRIAALEGYSDTVVCGLFCDFKEKSDPEVHQCEWSEATSFCPVVMGQIMSATDDNAQWSLRTKAIKQLTVSIGQWAFSQSQASDAARTTQKTVAVAALREQLPELLQEVFSKQQQQQQAVELKLQAVRDGPSIQQVEGFTLVEVEDWSVTNGLLYYAC